MSSMTSNEDDDQQILSCVEQQWRRLNDSLKDLPKFQNETRPPAKEENLKELESKLKINLPKEIRSVVRIHDGRNHIGYGLSYRLPTTDLLSIQQWKPYEKDNENFAEDLVTSLADEKDRCAHQNLREDFREHLKIYLETKDVGEKFQSIPCELLIIGQGMDDYAEQYLLSIRSGRIYLAVHNIPEWRLIGTFSHWIEEGLKSVQEDIKDLKEQHEDVKID